MLLESLVGLIAVAVIDLIVLHRRSSADFYLAFRGFGRKCVAMGAITLLAVIFLEKKPEIFTFFMVCFLLPLYLLRRDFLIKQFLIQKEKGEDAGGSKFVLLSDALGVILMWFFGTAVVSMIIQAFFEQFPSMASKLNDLVFSTLISSVMIVALISRATAKFSSHGFWFNVGMRLDTRPTWQIVVMPIVIGLFFAFSSAWIIVERHFQPQTPLSEILASTDSPLAIVTFIILAIFIAPLVEEIVFRGYFYDIFRRTLGPNFALYFISIGFAFLHVGQYWGDWMAIGMVTLLGFTLTMLKAWSGTTVASVVTHYVYNSGVTILTAIMFMLSNPAYFKYQVYYDYLDTQKKEELLLEAINQDPQLFDGYNELAWLYAEEGENLERGLDLIETALNADAENLSYLDTRRELLERIGRHQEAEEINHYLLEKNFYTEEE